MKRTAPQKVKADSSLRLNAKSDVLLALYNQNLLPDPWCLGHLPDNMKFSACLSL